MAAIKRLKPDLRLFHTGVPQNRITWDTSSKLIHNLILLNHSNALSSDHAFDRSLDNEYVTFNHEYTDDVPYSAVAFHTRKQLHTLEAKCSFLSQQTLANNYGDFQAPHYSTYQPFQCGEKEVTRRNGV